MRRLINISLVMVTLLTSYGLLAQRATTDDDKQDGKAARRPKIVHAYLGHSGLNGGQVTKRTFDSLLKQGLTARDSAGNLLQVDGFTFSYAERNLYEDSVGKLMILTDFFSEYCPGDTVSRGVSMNIYHKTKPGDTAYFDNIRVHLPTGGQTGTKGMKFVLIK